MRADIEMKKTNVLSYVTGLFLIVTAILPPITAQAESPWQWRKALQIDKVGDSMYMPSAVAFDKEGERYYVVDTGRNRLVSFDRDGNVIRAFTANEQLKSPFDMARIDNTKLWVVEKGRNSLTFIDVGAKKIETHTLRDGDRLVFPDRIAYANGKIYVLDRASGKILRLADDLSIEQRFGCQDCTAGMFDFVIDGNSVLAIDPLDKKIYRFNADGTIAEEIPLGSEAEFPVSLAVGPSGFIFVLDRHRNSVLVYSGHGQFNYSFVGPGQAEGEVYFPRQLRFDPWGNLCVVDEGNGRVEIFSQ